MNKFNNESELYFECHITIAPVTGEHLELAKKLSKTQKFKVAELLMKKRGTSDEFVPSDYDTFTTGHSKFYDDIEGRMLGLINDLNKNGFTVLRYKIEDTICDSKRNDYLNALINQVR